MGDFPYSGFQTEDEIMQELIQEEQDLKRKNLMRAFVAMRKIMPEAAKYGIQTCNEWINWPAVLSIDHTDSQGRSAGVRIYSIDADATHFVLRANTGNPSVLFELKHQFEQEGIKINQLLDESGKIISMP